MNRKLNKNCIDKKNNLHIGIISEGLSDTEGLA